MGLNRQLVDTVKHHFAKKSTADLEEIVRLKDRDQWSDESFVAAEEVLVERVSGRARAPRVPVKDTPPPSAGENLRELLPVLGFAVGGLLGGLIGRALSAEGPVTNGPVPFGSNIAWLSVETKETAAVAAVLGLQNIRDATWADGIAAAHRSSVFVTPPLGNWTLVVGAALLPHEQMDVAVKPLVEELSRHFPDAQYFCTHQGMELHGWARAQSGHLLRGYGWLGQRSRWNEGPETAQERSLKFRFTADSSEPDRGAGPNAPNEICVFRLASLWSIDPKTLEEQSAAPARGLLGDIPRRPNQAT